MFMKVFGGRTKKGISPGRNVPHFTGGSGHFSNPSLPAPERTLHLGSAHRHRSYYPIAVQISVGFSSLGSAQCLHASAVGGFPRNLFQAY